VEKSNKEKAKIQKIFGYHLALDLYNCNPEKARNIENCYEFLNVAPNIIETDIQSPPFVIYKKGVGFAGWIAVVESGISLYVSFPTNFIAVDIYSCKEYDYEKLKDFTKKIFEPKRIQEKRFLRGEQYIHPFV